MGCRLDLIEALTNRRTAPAFADTPVSRDTLERLIEAATWAPNHRNTEPWRFHVLVGTGRTDLGDHVAAWLRATEDPTTEAQIDSICKKLVRSPVIIAVSQVGSPDDAVRHLEDYAACSAAIQNLLLSAHAEGLVTKWSTGAMVTMPPAFEHLGLDPTDRIVGFVYLGYPPEETAVTPGERAPAVVSWRGFEG